MKSLLSLFEKFTKKFSLSKTLRFELIPQKKTREHIEKNGLIANDVRLAEKYKDVKKIIDRYHKSFIDQALSGLRLNVLYDFEVLYSKNFKGDKDKKEKEHKKIKELNIIKDLLRKQIADCFSKSENKNVAEIYKNLFSKDLIREDLLKFAEENEMVAINEFKNFTTYFTGFHENRKNIYTHEEKATAISYRLINDNLPMFIDNMKIFETILKNHPQLDFNHIESELKELLNGTPLVDVFSLNYFNQTLTQNSIELYNAILGGKTNNDQKSIKGLNQFINLYMQQRGIKLRELPKFKQLYKQILSDKQSLSLLPESFEEDNEALESIEKFYKHELCNCEKDGKTHNVLFDIKNLIQQLLEFDLSGVFIKNDDQLTSISKKIFGDQSIICNALSFLYQTEINPIKPNARPTKTYDDKKERWVEKSAYFSIADIEKALVLYKESNLSIKDKVSDHVICDYFIDACKEHKESEHKSLNVFEQVEVNYEQVMDLLNTVYPSDKKLAQDNTQITKIKTFLDSIKSVVNFIRPLNTKDMLLDKDEAFYSNYIALFNQINLATVLFDKVRNYLTKKPYSIDKIKLNFENGGNLGDGFVESNGLTQFGTYLLRKINGIKEYDYYLGISDDKTLFSKNNAVKHNDISEYQRLDYYQMKTTSFYGSSYQGLFGHYYDEDKKELIRLIKKFISNSTNEEMKQFIKKETVKQKIEKETPNKYISLIKEFSSVELDNLLADAEFHDLHSKVLSNIKTVLSKKYLSKFPQASKILKNTYVILNDIMSDIGKLAENKSFNYIKISNTEFNEATDRNKKPLFLFKITNKDLSYAEQFLTGDRTSRGLDNIHTMYFKALMSGDQDVFDLGTSEVFFRKKSLNYSKKIMQSGHHADILKDDFKYPIISNKRFAFDKFQFNLSINMNYKTSDTGNINWNVLNFLKNNPGIRLISIDRGERNLLYITLLDQNRKIIKQFSLNKIISIYKGKEYITNYYDKLKKREESRKEARRSWKETESIKTLKEGYLSHAVHCITQMMIDEKAIVVMEDLNPKFKRGRQKIESQVYQKFEKMLIDKLNFLVLKDSSSEEPGGVLNALQLSNKFEGFKKLQLSKQCGFIFYVPAAYTSTIDPATGFVNFLRPKYESVKESIKFFGKFDSIRFNKSKQWFEFAFDYNNFTTKAEGTKTQWTVCTTNEVRYLWNKNKENTDNKGGYEEYNISERLKVLFGKLNINYGDGNDIKNQIISQSSAEFHKEIIKLLSVTMLLRYKNDKIDYILSPVANIEGVFFNSLNVDPKIQPENSDANGAYNIGLKGLLILEQINKTSDLEGVKLAITNKQWLNYVQNVNTPKAPKEEIAMVKVKKSVMA